MSQTEKQSLTAPTPSGGAAEPLTGTMECPICGRATPHAHYVGPLPEPLTELERRDILAHGEWRSANNVRLAPEAVLQIEARYEATVVALESQLLAARRGEHAARAQLAIANNLLSTFRDHAAIPEVLANDVEEIDAYLAALAATPEGPCDRFPPTDLLPDEDW